MRHIQLFTAARWKSPARFFGVFHARLRSVSHGTGSFVEQGGEFEGLVPPLIVVSPPRCSNYSPVPLSAEHVKLWNMPLMEKPEGERELLDLLGKELRAKLPESWRLELTAGPRYGRAVPDAQLRISGPDGVSAQILVEAKATLNARDVPNLLARLDAAIPIASEPLFGPPLVVSRYIPPRARALLMEAGASYLDATGNKRVTLERPALYVETTGASADPWRGPERETRTLRGKPAARVTRGLVDFTPPLGIRELSKLSGASLGSTYRTVDFLDREALIRRDKRGAVVEVDWPNLLLRWSEDYSFQGSNQISRALEPRGTDRVIEKLRGSVVDYAVTGSMSARRVTELAPPQVAMIFTADPEGLAASLDLRDGAGAANVFLARPFDDVVFARTTEEDGIRYAAFSQTAVDLLAGPGRDPGEGRALIEWMVANEGDWRG